MKNLGWQGGLIPPAIAVMAATLLLLAGLQYRWIGEIAEADRERLRRGAEASAQQFRDDFNRELRRVARSFDIGNDALLRRDWQRFVDRLESWRAAGGRYLYVEDLFVREAREEGDGRVLRLAPGGRSLIEGEMPPPFERWFQRGPGRGGPGGGGPGFRGGFGRAGAVFVGEGPALMFGLLALTPPEESGGRMRPDFVGTLVIVLTRESITGTLLPDLAHRYFGSPGESIYDVAVVQRDERGDLDLVYSSSEGLTAESFAAAEVEIPLLWRREEAPEGQRFRAVTVRRGPGERPPPEGNPFFGGDVNLGELLFESVAPAGPGGGEWIVAVNAAGGSLDAAVDRLRRRNLGISLSILALLAAGMAILLISTQRAARLARLQMEFVAGVSHELRTPLAVIRSAGDNLAEGVVQAQPQVREYGKLIRDEGRRLTGMVEQTLQFASTQAGRQQYKLESLPAGEVLRRAIDELRPAVEEAGFTLEERLEPGLPRVQVDVAAASRVLQSLVENALKYGGDSRWLGIGAASRNGAVEVTVRDQGVGIDEDDLPHIFDPFYRGKRATDAQIHGTGLGLALARSAAEGFGGKLLAESRPGEGAAFTLVIPRPKES